MPPVGLCTQLACIWESTARKPGNVHRFRDFDDLTYLDLVTSAAAIAPVLERACEHSIGQTVLAGVRATRQVVATNSNLGILLLMAPLASVREAVALQVGLEAALTGLDIEDSCHVYEAIRMATPGGLGRTDAQDVRSQPTLPLRQIMALAADRDLVARQYTNGFREVFESGVPELERGLRETQSLEGAIIKCALCLMADDPDTLIARKRGVAEAEHASHWARRILDLSWPYAPESREAFASFDAWLRAAGHGRNPGTTADLVTACLFVALREGRITLPPQYPWTLEFPP